MKYLTIIVLLLFFSSIAAGQVSTRVCLADANTPLELADPNIITDPNVPTDPNVFVYRDIMVGTKLTIIVDSNISGSWEGGLFIAGSNRDYGELSARDYNDITHDWEGSRLEAVGDKARVWDVQEDVRSGFSLRSNNTAVEGDWFILDYNAINIGVCTVDFFDYSMNLDNLVNSHIFSHVRTRDFNQDTKVDFADLAFLALYWLQADCSDPDWCAGTDLNSDGVVNHDDLMLFADFWLERTE
jgi:hypothetical protein